MIGKRQLHLDFHNSPEIADIGKFWNPAQFVETVEGAAIDSVTLFAKCHHGLAYYPSTVCTQHPALHSRDLLGEQIEALHSRGIRCPVYLTVGIDEVSAHKQVDWRQLDQNGHSVRAKPLLGEELLAGGWYFMNWLHPDYMDLIVAQVEELDSMYSIDGYFFDIVVFDPSAGWSPFASMFCEKRGLDLRRQGDFERFLPQAQRSFTQRMSRIIRGMNPNATIFYNAAANLTTAQSEGIRARADAQSHYEIESLPTGHWGYHHFPRVARFVAGLGIPWTGQTGRFQKSWGDFGGLKPQPALEYECFRTQALGGAIGVGDQLLPDGRFDPGAIKRISAVMHQVKEAEPFYLDANPFFDIAILAAGSPDGKREQTLRAESGALLLCQKARRNPIFIDDAADFEQWPAIILPDSVIVDETLAQKLQSFMESGGKLILSHRSGFDKNGLWQLDFLPFKPTRPCGFHPTYWRIPESFGKDNQAQDRVIYSEGLTVEWEKPAVPLIHRVLPRFQRTDATFSSHFQAPPRTEEDPQPALLRGNGFLYFSDPIFRDFRQSHQEHLAIVWKKALREFVGAPLIDPSLPDSIEVIPMRKGPDLLLTLLRFLPVRKALEIDVIDERLPFDGENLKLSFPPLQLFQFPQEREIINTEHGFALNGKGRLLLCARGYFAP